MIRRLLVLLLAFGAASIGARAAYACSCAGVRDLREAVERSDVAFVGTADHRLGGWAEVTVEGVVKGTVGERVRMRARSEQHSACGGADLPDGRVLYSGDRSLLLTICSYVWEGAEADRMLAESGLPLRPPDPAVGTLGPPPPGFAYWLRIGALVAALGGVVVAGAVVVSRRRPVYDL